jgi:hypothetical protein
MIFAVARSAPARVALVGVVALTGCSRSAPSDAPVAAADSVAPSASAASSTVAPAAAASAPSAKLAPPPPLGPMACCTMDVAEGSFGARGTFTRYSGDYLRRKDGERLMFPQDLISDTKELFQHAKSAGKSVTQERRVRPVGEGAKYISVEIEDKGETGALMPFQHSACKTVDLRTGRALKLEDVIGKEAAAKAIAAGESAFAATGGHEDYRFLSSSFAMIGRGEKAVRFCSPRRREDLGGARLDVEVSP